MVRAKQWPAQAAVTASHSSDRYPARAGASREDLREAWRKLGFRIFEGVVGSSAPLGMAAMAVMPQWAVVLMTFALAAITKSLSGVPGEVRVIVVSDSARKSRPLFVFDRLVATGRSATPGGST